MQTMGGLYGCYSTATATTKITFARPRDMGALQNVQCSMECHSGVISIALVAL